MVALDGIDPESIDTLRRLGYRSLEHIAAMSVEELANIPGISAESGEKIRDGAVMLQERRARGEEFAQPCASRRVRTRGGGHVGLATLKD